MIQPTLKLSGDALKSCVLKAFTDASTQGAVITTASLIRKLDWKRKGKEETIRRLDISGAFIPNSTMDNPGATVGSAISDSASHDGWQTSRTYAKDQVVAGGALPTRWQRVKSVLALPGVLKFYEISQNTPVKATGYARLDQCVVELNREFEPEEIRVFMSDFKKSKTCGDIWDVIEELLDLK